MNYSSSDESLKLGSESDTDSDADNEAHADNEDQMENEVNEVQADNEVNADNQTQEDEISEYETDDSSEEEDQEAYAYIKDFPVNLIFLEKCDGTLDRLFMDQEINTEQGAACLMQIVMALLAFQKAFHFTHNDLHTNNVMYVNTDIEWLYYKYENQFYRVPTYGRIFKIIDFGRAIYRFKDRIYCSDSFASKGDAHSQYNTEPYFNENKPRIEPNLSFDLCRLGTSIYDFIIQDEEDERDEFQETIYRWCLDDNGKNVMYKRDGEERYPGFKLYKMIAKNVHAHTPAEQLKFAFFNQFLLAPNDAAMLDETEVRQQGLNIDLIAKEYV
jgi:serine/threonine protein kinase